MDNDLLNLADLYRSVEPTLAALPDDERKEAISWLREHVASTNSPDVQRILIDTFLSIYDRPLWQRVYEATRR